MKYAVAYKEGEILATFQYERWAQEWKDKHCYTCVIVALLNNEQNAQASVATGDAILMNDDNKINPVKEGERIYSKEDMIGFAEWIGKNEYTYLGGEWWQDTESENARTSKQLFNLYLQSLIK